MDELFFCTIRCIHHKQILSILKAKEYPYEQIVDNLFVCQSLQFEQPDNTLSESSSNGVVNPIRERASR